MIKIKKPTCLSPHIYKCDNCGCLVKYHKPTDSYYIIKVPKDGIKNCKFCYNLSQLSAPESIGIKVKEE